MRLAFLGFLFAASGLGCRQTVAPAVPLQITIESSQTIVARGDTVTFIVHATGNNLFGVAMEYGDMGTDQYATGGAHSARVTFKHAWETAGSFTVRAVVTDAVLGEKEASIGIVVN